MFHFLRIHTVPAEEEGSTWLQLFFDLVYVAILVELGNRLGSNLDIEGFITFVLLLIPIWWSWLEFVDYGRRYPVDDIGQRILTVVYMAVMLVIAFEIHTLTVSSTTTFFVTYGLSKFVLALMYSRAWIYYPNYRFSTSSRAAAFTVVGLLWVAIALTASDNLWMWILVIILGAIMPRFIQLLRGVPNHSDLQTPPFKYHFTLYRFGELTIIVLGEFFIKLVISSAGRELSPINYLVGAGLLSISVSIWWLYFDHLEHANLTQAGTHLKAWVYSHFPFTAGIVVYGVVGNMIFAAVPKEPLPNAERLLFTVALGTALLAYGAIEWASRERDEPLARSHQPWIRLISAAALITLGILGRSLNVGYLVMIVLAVLLFQVALDVRVRLQRPEPVAIHNAVTN